VRIHQKGLLLAESIPAVMRRPRVKSEHAPYRIAGSKIRIGWVSYGIAAEISDPDGWVWTMLTAMDGSRDLAAIVEHVHSAHPRESVNVLRRGAEQLLASGYVEDAAGPIPVNLTERDLRRYDRAVGFFRWLDLTPRASSWEPQARLRDARVTILGLGGSGGIAALALAASGVGHLNFVDPDDVELSNLSRKVLYTEDDIGKSKADSAIARITHLNRDIEITGQRMEATSTDDVLGLIADCDVLLLTADRPPELRMWVNRACLIAKRPWVYGGYHGPLIQTGVFVPGEGSCWECNARTLDTRNAEIGAHTEDSPQRRAAMFRAVSATSAGLSGYLAAQNVISLLTGIPPAVPGQVSMVNLAAIDASQVFSEPPHPECDACAATKQRLWRTPRWASVSRGHRGYGCVP
jgi:bacteriocin biosynthesis cyclodehydratase domain-containing protein